MAKLAQLTAGQQAELDKATIEPIYYRLTLHTDDGDQVLEDDLISVDAPRMSKRIDLDESIEQFTVGGISVKLLNEDRKFDAEKAGALFNVFRTATVTTISQGALSVKVPFISTVPLGLSSIYDLIGYKATLSDGKVSWTGTISQVAPTDSNTRHRFTFTSIFSPNYAMPIGSVFTINDLIGRPATLEYILNDSGEKLTAGKYIIERLPDFRMGEAEIRLKDALGNLLSDNLGANTASVKEYQRADASEGTLSIDETNVNWSKAHIGSWEVEITKVAGSTISFSVQMPDGRTKEGSSTQHWYSDPQGFSDYSSLEILTSDWSGTFEIGDKIIIETFYQQPSAHTHLAEGLNQVVGNCLSSDFYDSSASNTLIANWLPLMHSIAPVGLFKRQITCLQAAAVFCHHLNLSMYIGTDGKLDYSFFQPIYNASPATLDGDTEITDDELEVSYRQPIDAVKVLYDYSYTTGEFAYSYTFPENSQANAVELKMPFYLTRSQAKAAAERYYAMWNRGGRIVGFKVLFNHGIALALAERFEVSSHNPPLSGVPVLIFDLSKNKDKGIVDVKAFDTQHAWGDVGFYDVDNYDSGKVYF